MRMMIDMGNQRGPLYIIDTATSVDCTKDVRLRRSFRSLVECMVLPCCGFQPSTTLDSSDKYSSSDVTSDSTTTVTGTFFGYRKGRVSFCIQESSKAHPLLLLEFAVPTAYLAKEMQHGLLRVALECDPGRARARSGPGKPDSLFNVPVWTMYCNGRKVGYAVKRSMSEGDAEVFKMMRSVSVGAGVLPVAGDGGGGDLMMYLRARFERVIGSADSESFHMINPVGSTGQELSIFMLRSS